MSKRQAGAPRIPGQNCSLCLTPPATPSGTNRPSLKGTHKVLPGKITLHLGDWGRWGPSCCPPSGAPMACGGRGHRGTAGGRPRSFPTPTLTRPHRAPARDSSPWGTPLLSPSEPGEDADRAGTGQTQTVSAHHPWDVGHHGPPWPLPSAENLGTGLKNFSKIKYNHPYKSPQVVRFWVYLEAGANTLADAWA